MARNYKQGYYTPRHPEKYVGDVTKIVYRSSWELESFNFLDGNPNVLRWSSENVVIPYIKPTDGRIHKYFPDLWVEYKDRAGNIKQELVEIKPIEQTRAPRRGQRKNVLYEQVTYAINMAKWEAAKAWCARHNMEFRVVTAAGIFK